MNILQLEDKLTIWANYVGVPVYDFNFNLYFKTTHPYRFDNENICVLRIGAIDNYATRFYELLDKGLRLVNTPEEHLRATELEKWYPLIKDLTPRSKIYDILPKSEKVEVDFDWPVFIKGSRQTSKHNATLSIAKNQSEYEIIQREYQKDGILRWQKPVIRELVQLEKVDGVVPHQVPPSKEYRSFWWNGELVGCGRYWYQVPMYSSADLNEGLKISAEVARRLEVPFLVVDFAKTIDGTWIVIECNDGQESGYTAISPQLLWANILEKN